MTTMMWVEQGGNGQLTLLDCKCEERVKKNPVRTAVFIPEIGPIEVYYCRECAKLLGVSDLDATHSFLTLRTDDVIGKAKEYLYASLEKMGVEIEEYEAIQKARKRQRELYEMGNGRRKKKKTPRKKNQGRLREERMKKNSWIR